MITTHRAGACAAAVAAAFLASCGSDTNAPQSQTTTEQENVAAADANAQVEMPPMVVRSAAYRCDDGNALYVDVLSDDNAVSVRDSRQDLPVRLERQDGSGEFTGANRTLSGVGDEVQYSAPDRPMQECRAAPA